MRTRRLILSALLLGLATSVHASEEDAVAAWKAAKATAVEKLEALATRANGRKLYRSRNEIYTIVLVLEPDHRKARSWLKYKRRDGVWVRPRYTLPKDRGSKASRAEHAESVRAWRTWWRDQVIRVHRQAEDAGDRSTADSVLRRSLGLDADDPSLRALAGESVRVVGAVDAAELVRHHQIAESAAAVFASVFGVAARLPSDSEDGDGTFPFYVTATREQGNGFLVTEPGIAKSDLAVLGDLDLSFLPT